MRSNDNGSMGLEQALLIALVALVVSSSLYLVGTAIAAKMSGASDVAGSSGTSQEPGGGDTTPPSVVSGL